MFLEDELEYHRLKRSDNIMGWLAILFVAALVFMFAGMMNSASASGKAAHIEDGRATLIMEPNRQVADMAGGQLITVSAEPMGALFSVHGMRPSAQDLAVTAEAAKAAATDAAANQPARIDPLTTESIGARATGPGERHIMMGLMLVAFALTGSSFLLLAFGGPRRPHEAEDDADVA